jgi:hypothetical protein
MVQDMMDVEYVATGQDSDSFHLSSPLLVERTPLFVSPIPFTTSWFRNAMNDDGRELQIHRQKRHRLQEHQPEEEINLDKVADSWPAQQLQSDPNAVPFMAMLYYDQYRPNRTHKSDDLQPTTRKLMLNELVEIVGVVEYTDEEIDGPSTDMQDEEWDRRVALPSNLPRIHVLWYQATDLDSLIVTNYGPRAFPSDMSSPLAVASALAKALAISQTAATALWMSLLSMAERQPRQNEAASQHWAPVSTPQETTLGCASINLVLPSESACSNFAKRLCTVLSHLLPHVQCHTIQNGHASIETASLLLPPRKQDGRLVPNRLQLPKGSTLILNIGSTRADNPDKKQTSLAQQEQWHLLERLASTHKMDYVFDGNINIAFEADVRVIVLSTETSESKSLPCSMKVYCAVDDESAGDTMDSEGGTDDSNNFSYLHGVRQALMAARRKATSSALNQNIALPRTVLEQAQMDFVERRDQARQNGTATMPDDKDFHRWLTLTRLQARSRGAISADANDWKYALELDDAMQATLVQRSFGN